MIFRPQLEGQGMFKGPEKDPKINNRLNKQRLKSTVEINRRGFDLEMGVEFTWNHHLGSENQHRE